MKWFKRLRVLPLLVLVASLTFGVRFTEFVIGVSKAPGSANAQEKMVEPENLDPIKVPEVVKENADLPMGELTSVNTSPTEPPDMTDGEKIEWKDSSDSELEFSNIKMEMFEDLKKRRKELEQQARELSVREALLKTAEQELDKKYQELVSLKSEIEALLVKQNDEEEKRVASLVKIYEGMKPKDAARIFNTLDLDILLSVVSQMSERKSAPIIAAMIPERAKTLTTMLMEQKSLNDLSSKVN